MVESEGKSADESEWAGESAADPKLCFPCTKNKDKKRFENSVDNALRLGETGLGRANSPRLLLLLLHEAAELNGLPAVGDAGDTRLGQEILRADGPVGPGRGRRRARAVGVAAITELRRVGALLVQTAARG